MTITRVRQTGAEHGTLAELDGSAGYAGGQIAISSANKRTGVYSFHSFCGSIAWEYGYINFPATRQIRIGFAHKGYNNRSTPLRCMVIRRASADAVTCTLGNSNILYLNANGLTDSVVWSNTWRHIGIDAKIDPVDGWVSVYFDGQEVMSVAGNTGNADVLSFRFGKFDAANSTTDMYWDDFYFDDATGEIAPAPLSMRKFYFIKPNAVGNYSQWTPSSGSGFECVDEVPPSDADYVETNVVDEIDSYNMATFSTGTGALIKAVIPSIRALRGDVTEEIILGTRYSGIDLEGSSQPLGAGYGYISEYQATKPGGGVWDQAALDDVEVLIKSSGSF